MANSPLASRLDLAQRAGQARRLIHDVCADFVPDSLKNSLSADPRSVVVHWHGRGSPAMAALDEIPEPADRAFFDKVFQKWGALVSISLIVPRRECLVRELTIPKTALSRMDEVLRFDVEANLPFRSSELYQGWFIKDGQVAGDTNVVTHVMIKRSLLEDLIQSIDEAGLPLREIGVADADGERLAINLLDRPLRRRASAVRTSATILGASAVAACVLSAAAFATTVLNLQSAVETAEAELQKATREAQVVRKDVAAAEQTSKALRHARLRKRETVPLTAIWEEITRILPDETWLTELRSDEGRLRIDGQSENASQLIGALAKSPLFSNVAFASPVTRDPQRGYERFQIQLTVGSAK